MKGYFKTPIGWLEINEEAYGIKGLKFVYDYQVDEDASMSPYMEKVKKQVIEFLSGDREKFDLEYKLEGSDFEKAVWAEIKKVPYGSTTTYRKIAETIGSKSVSKVVQATKDNPLAFIIPCHRVINVNGNLTSYCGGVKAKRALLTLERTRTPIIEEEY